MTQLKQHTVSVLMFTCAFILSLLKAESGITGAFIILGFAIYCFEFGYYLEKGKRDL